jgi:hypothetical protein
VLFSTIIYHQLNPSGTTALAVTVKCASRRAGSKIMLRKENDSETLKSNKAKETIIYTEINTENISPVYSNSHLPELL